MFHDHPHGRPADPVWQALSQTDDMHVVHLWRSNLLHVVLSETLAERSDHWVQRADQAERNPEPEKPLVLDPQKLGKQFASMTRMRQLRRRQLVHLPAIDIEFEDLRHDRERTFARLCRFLELPEQAARPWTVRQRQRPAHELIENYRELEIYFSNTPWAEFFAEGR